MSNGPSGNSASGAGGAVGPGEAGGRDIGPPGGSSASPAGAEPSFDFMTETFDSPAPQGAAKEPSGALAEPSPAPAPPGAPQPEPAPEPAPSAAPPSAPDQPGQSSGQQGSPPVGGEAPKFDPADPISLARGLADNAEEAIQHLASTTFRLSPQELEALETNVAEAVPRLLARAVVYSQTQFLTQLSRVVPLMLQRHSTVSERHNQNLSEFYSAWPSLDRGKHNEAVTALAVRYRQMFPDVPKDQMIEQVGQMALAQLGLPIVGVTRKGQPAAAPAGRTRSPGSSSPAGAARGFVPAAPGTVSHVQQVPDDPWGYMGLQDEGA